MMCHSLTPAHRWVQELAVSLAILLQLLGAFAACIFLARFYFSDAVCICGACIQC